MNDTIFDQVMNEPLTDAERIAHGLPPADVTEPLTTEEIEQIALREGAATPGPWSFDPRPDHGYHEAAVHHGGPADYGCLAKVWGGPTHGTANAAFIAHAREDIPRFRATVEARDKTIAERDAEIARLREGVYEKTAAAVVRATMELARLRERLALVDAYVSAHRAYQEILDAPPQPHGHGRMDMDDRRANLEIVRARECAHAAMIAAFSEPH